MGALQYVDQPDYSAIIFRRSYAELTKPGALVDRAGDWLAGTDAKWNEQKAQWRFPSGAILAFGYLKHRDDKNQYQSAEFDFIGFDELTHFNEVDYLFMFSRLRRKAGSRIPPRVRGATNPGGRGHKWVKERFVDQPPTTKRAYVPARLWDNPGADRESYLISLQEVDEMTRAQLLDGNWEAREPGNWVFDDKGITAATQLGAEFDALLAAGEMPEPASGFLGVGIDWGDFRTHALLLWALERGGLYIPPLEIAASRSDVNEIAADILRAASRYDHWLGQEPFDSSFAQSNATFLAHCKQRLGPYNPIAKTGAPQGYKVAFSKHKSNTVSYLRLLLRRAARGERTRVLAISPQNQILLEQLRSYEQDEVGKFVKGNDDAVDSLIAGATPIAVKYRSVLEAEEQKRREQLAREQQLAIQGGQRV